MRPFFIFFMLSALLLSSCAFRDFSDPAAASSPFPTGTAEESASSAAESDAVDEPEPDPVSTPDPILVQLSEMTTEQKVGQLLIAGIEGTEAGEDAVTAIQDLSVGGIILFSRNVDSCTQTVELVNQLKDLNSDGIPLFIAADEEGGLVSRMPDEVLSLPSAYTFGSTGDPDLCYQLGLCLAAECKAIGVNLDFAPVADVWSNPQNTVIGARSFGSDAETVSQLVVQVSDGLSKSGIIPVVKHFPGHGDTLTDSHYELPVISKSLEDLQSLELLPFTAAIENGAPAVMVAHLVITDLDETLPASLSPSVVTGLLREELLFDGVVFTDDLTMGAISETHSLGEAAVLAVEAGCDMLLVCHGADNLMTAYQALLDAVNTGRISVDRLDESVCRILRLKDSFGITNDPVPEPDLDTLNDQLSQLLQMLEQ